MNKKEEYKYSLGWYGMCYGMEGGGMLCLVLPEECRWEVRNKKSGFYKKK